MINSNDGSIKIKVLNYAGDEEFLSTSLVSSNGLKPLYPPPPGEQDDNAADLRNTQYADVDNVSRAGESSCLCVAQMFQCRRQFETLFL